VTTDAFPPMPDFDCPSWCDRDHEADWRMHVAVGRDTRPIPTADGGLRYPDTSLSEWLELFEPFHLHKVARVDLGRGRVDEYAQVDLQRGVEEVTLLYVNADGDMTAEQARAFAAELLKAADVLEQVADAPLLDDRGQVAGVADYRPVNR
jgi:hypothetical protein